MATIDEVKAQLAVLTEAVNSLEVTTQPVNEIHVTDGEEIKIVEDDAQA